MPKNKMSDPITDQEIAFARLVLSGTMTDRHAAETVGLNPDSAAYTKSKPHVRAYMHQHRAAVQQQIEDRRLKNRLGQEMLARCGRSSDGENARSDDRSNAQCDQAPNAQRFFQPPVRLFGSRDQSVDAFGAKELAHVLPSRDRAEAVITH